MPEVENNHFATSPTDDKVRYKLIKDLLPDLKDLKILDADRENPFSLSYPYKLNFALNGDEDLDFYVFDFEDSTFDAAFSFEVVEHLMNPRHYLYQINRVLKPGGRFFITTPIAYYPPWIFSFKHHFHEMRLKSLKDLIYISGFEIKMIKKMRRPLSRSLGPLKMIRYIFGTWWYVEAVKI